LEPIRRREMLDKAMIGKLFSNLEERTWVGGREVGFKATRGE
jgi:hypothetical protein